MIIALRCALPITITKHYAWFYTSSAPFWFSHSMINLQKKAVTHIYHATPYPVNEKALMYAGNWCKLNDYFHFPSLKSIDRGTTIILSISISSSLLRTSQLKYITVMIISLYCFVAKCFMDIDHVWCEMSDSFVLLKRISFNTNHEFGSR